MATVQVCIGHDHQTAVAQFSQRIVDLAMLEPEDLLEVGKLLVVGHLFYRRIPYIARLAPEWKHAIRIAAYNAQTGNGQRFRRVSLRDDKCALVTPVRARPVGIVELRNARNARLFGPVCLLELLFDQRETLRDQVIEDTRSEYVFDEFWFQINGILNL